MPSFDRNTDKLVYLQARYGVTNPDLQTLIARYNTENPSNYVDRQKTHTDLDKNSAR